ncbi:MAG: TrkH family potassium uptake protein [Myxococcales bacterium]|nr:TrkH family potassium uptake protein [Myxococcales bacterium]
MPEPLRPPKGDPRLDSVAPPPQSVLSAGPERVTTKRATEGSLSAVEHGSGGVSAAVLTVAVIIAGGADFFLVGARWSSVLAGAVLTTLSIPWVVTLLRRRHVQADVSPRPWRLLTFQIANAGLVVAFNAAKWSLLLRALRGEPAPDGAYQTYVAAVVLLLLIGLALRAGRVARLVALSADHPARLMALSFGTAGWLGALLLALPVSLRDVGKVSFLDSLFMSVSAVCVTGLTTVNVAETYTLVGQLVLCVLMQIGGLGIMALTAAVTMLAGQRIGVKSSAVLAEMVDVASLVDLKRTLRAIVAYTIVFEALGATVLYVQLAPIAEVAETASDPGPMAGAGSAAWAAIFHSVSAFCNGSLSNFRGGMVPFAGHHGICQTLAILILLGGLGFPVIHELTFRAVDKLRGRRLRRLSLNTRIALLTSAILVASMAVAYLALESGASFRELSIPGKVNAAVFQSACARTSGFNVVDVAAMRPATLLLTCFAMFVGADPGSTAGGIKTTTLAVLFASYRAELRGRKPTLFDRTIPEAVVRRAVGVAFISTAVICAVLFVLTVIERFDTLALFFEVTSAFSTTGISTGITPGLSVTSKLLLVLTMLFGRVGPLTVALALSGRQRRVALEFPEERVMIG